MSNRKYDETSVVRELNRTQGVSINQASKVINVNKHNHSLGNRGWGKVDFLIHYCGYYLSWEYTQAVITSNKEQEDLKRKPKKEALNLRITVKDIMSDAIKF
jgi:hypothetical protein